jgi:CBS domain-containing protein
MTRVADIMTRGVRAMRPSDSVVHAAQAMEELNVGAVPVCDGQRLVGMVTDRDITIRAVAQGKADLGVTLSKVMSSQVRWCYEDQEAEEVLRDMSQRQIRRLPVVDRDKHLVGMVSLGDMATKMGGPQVARSLADISEPAEPDRSHQSQASGSAGGGSSKAQFQSGSSPRGSSPADEDAPSQGA